jgi:hypothetical protein
MGGEMGKKGKVGGKLTITMNDSLDEKMLRAPGVPRYRRRGVYGGNKQINSRSTQTKLNKSSARNPTTARELNQNPHTAWDNVVDVIEVARSDEYSQANQHELWS